jgi:hypothetical protein
MVHVTSVVATKKAFDDAEHRRSLKSYVALRVVDSYYLSAYIVYLQILGSLEANPIAK